MTIEYSLFSPGDGVHRGGHGTSGSHRDLIDNRHWASGSCRRWVRNPGCPQVPRAQTTDRCRKIPKANMKLYTAQIDNERPSKSGARLSKNGGHGVGPRAQAAHKPSRVWRPTSAGKPAGQRGNEGEGENSGNVSRSSRAGLCSIRPLRLKLGPDPSQQQHGEGRRPTMTLESEKKGNDHGRPVRAGEKSVKPTSFECRLMLPIKTAEDRDADGRILLLSDGRIGKSPAKPSLAGCSSCQRTFDGGELGRLIIVHIVAGQVSEDNLQWARARRRDTRPMPQHDACLRAEHAAQRVPGSRVPRTQKAPVM